MESSSPPPAYDVSVATFADLDPRTAYALWALRESVFVVEQDCPYQELDGRDLEPATRHVWADSEAGPIGYLRVLDDDEHARIGRVVVARSHRGRGLSGVLMGVALEVVDARPCVLDAQAPLAGWYAGFGFEVVGAEFLEDGIPHLPMRRG